MASPCTFCGGALQEEKAISCPHCRIRHPEVPPSAGVKRCFGCSEFYSGAVTALPRGAGVAGGVANVTLNVPGVGPVHGTATFGAAPLANYGCQYCGDPEPRKHYFQTGASGTGAVLLYLQALAWAVASVPLLRNAALPLRQPGWRITVIAAALFVLLIALIRQARWHRRWFAAPLLAIFIALPVMLLPSTPWKPIAIGASAVIAVISISMLFNSLRKRFAYLP